MDARVCVMWLCSVIRSIVFKKHMFNTSLNLEPPEIPIPKNKVYDRFFLDPGSPTLIPVVKTWAVMAGDNYYLLPHTTLIVHLERRGTNYLAIYIIQTSHDKSYDKSLLYSMPLEHPVNEKCRVSLAKKKKKKKAKTSTPNV